MTRELHSFFDTHPHIHISTFGGAELGCAVALEVLDIVELERRVDRALATGDESNIEVLGYGEISCVLAWHTGDEAVAAKRLPLFDSTARFEAYRGAFDFYLEALGEAGVHVVPSHLETTPAADDRTAAWCLQPLLDPSTLAPNWLKTADEDDARWLIGRIADHVIPAVGPRLGLDGQQSRRRQRSMPQ